MNIIEGIDIQHYRGMKLDFPLRLEQVISLMESFKNHEILHYNYVTTILYECGLLYQESKNMMEITIPKQSGITIVGNLNGQLEDLFTILSLNGLPSPSNMYLFTGDYVDYGENGIEILMTIFAFKLLYPESVFHLRGCHENLKYNHMFGFSNEVKKKYNGNDENDPTRPNRILQLVEFLYHELPLAALIDEKIFVVHGGISEDSYLKLKQINYINRHRDCPEHGITYEDHLFECLIWSDPRPCSFYKDPFNGYKPSSIGLGVEYGCDLSTLFCKNNKCVLIVRGHEYLQEGYEVLHENRVIGVFSASCFRNINNNKGGYIRFNCDLHPEIQQYYSSNIESDKKLPLKLFKSLKELTIELMREEIIYHKSELYWYSSQKDLNNTGKISLLDWSLCLKNVFRVDLPLLHLSKDLLKLETDGLVKYNDFLDRFSAVYEDIHESLIVPLVDKISKRIYILLSNIISSLKEDHSNCEFIGDMELMNIMLATNIGLSEYEIRQLIRILPQTSNHMINLSEFKDNFTVSFEPKEDMKSLIGEIKDDKMFGILIQKISVSLLEDDMLIRSLYKDFDKENIGDITVSDFYELLTNLHFRLKDEDISRLSDCLDDTSSGKICYKTFYDCIKVKSKDNHLLFNIHQTMTLFMYKYRFQLQELFFIYDENNNKSINIADLELLLRNINILTDNILTEEQIGVMMECFKSEDVFSYYGFDVKFHITDNLRK